MGELGNVFDALDTGEPAGADARRGRDLVARVQVDPRSLGAPQGQRVSVPRELDLDGECVARAPHPNDEGDEIVLHLSEGFPDGGGLKLRGQGEAGHAGGAAGDLLLQVAFVARPGAASALAARATAAFRRDPVGGHDAGGELATGPSPQTLRWVAVVATLAGLGALAWPWLS